MSLFICQQPTALNHMRWRYRKKITAIAFGSGSKRTFCRGAPNSSSTKRTALATIAQISSNGLIFFQGCVTTCLEAARRGRQQKRIQAMSAPTNSTE
jgi:hypothetical protein